MLDYLLITSEYIDHCALSEIERIQPAVKCDRHHLQHDSASFIVGDIELMQTFVCFDCVCLDDILSLSGGRVHLTFGEGYRSRGRDKVAEIC